MLKSILPCYQMQHMRDRVKWPWPKSPTTIQFWLISGPCCGWWYGANGFVQLGAFDPVIPHSLNNTMPTTLTSNCLWHLPICLWHFTLASLPKKMASMIYWWKTVKKKRELNSLLAHTPFTCPISYPRKAIKVNHSLILRCGQTITHIILCRT